MKRYCIPHPSLIFNTDEHHGTVIWLILLIKLIIWMAHSLHLLHLFFF